MNFNFKGLQALTEVQYDYKYLLSRRGESSFFRMRQKYHESRDKAGKLLSKMLKTESNIYYLSIRAEEGELKASFVDINNTCQNFYVNL